MIQLLTRYNDTQMHLIFNVIAKENTDITFLKGVTPKALILTVGVILLI